RSSNRATTTSSWRRTGSTPSSSPPRKPPPTRRRCLMKSQLRSLLPALLLLAAEACGAAPTTPDEEDPTQSFRGAAPEEAPKVHEFVAVVTSRLVKTISTDFEAKVLKMHVSSGQVVKTGELVAELDTTELRSKLAEAEAKRMEAAGQAGAAYAR